MATHNAVEQNYMARQILVAQQRLHDNFVYRPDMDSAYWISGAADLCRDLNVRNPVDIARLLTAELRNCRPIQDVVEQHISSHEPEVGPNTQCSPVCLLEFALSNDRVYTKPTADLTSALARYVKPPTMDVNEHLTAHLAKEEDLLRRRDVRISPAALQEAMYGSENEAGKHIAGSAEDAVVARLLDSLRPSEPDLIEHLDRLILFLGESNWTLKSLIEAIRSYERKMNSLPASSSSGHRSALIRHYNAKSEARSSRSTARAYNLYDPTTYTQPERAHLVPEEPPAKRIRLADTSKDNDNPALIQSIAKLSSVAETLKNMYEDKKDNEVNKTPFKPTRQPRRRPTHCLRCGSPSHLIYQCSTEDDNVAKSMREENSEKHGFKPDRRFAEHGTSLAHTWTLRHSRWPRLWLKPLKQGSKN